MNNIPSKEELEKQHTEVMDNRVVRDELLKVEALFTATLAQVEIAQEKCRHIPHLRDTFDNLTKMREAMEEGSRHKLFNIQLSVNHRAAYKD